MAGTSVHLNEVRVEDALPYTIKAVVSVADNPVIGRPQVALFDFGVSPEGGKESVCAADLVLNLVDYSDVVLVEEFLEGEEDAAVSEDGLSVQNCQYALKIDDRSCSDHVLYWDGANYQLKKIPEE